MIESNTQSCSLLTRSFEELHRSASSADESRLNNMRIGVGSATTQTARTIAGALLTQHSSEVVMDSINPKSLLPRYQAASALNDMASLLIDNERVPLDGHVGGKTYFSAAQLREKAQHLSPQISDRAMVHGQPHGSSATNREHRVSQLLNTYTSKIREIQSIENQQNN